MKLKNKISGEIKEFSLFDGNGLQGGVTLESLTKEWEDYEEPKKTWFIDTYGSVRDREAMTLVVGWDNKPIFEFETKEEAEKAVEKLKAWKRLKDKGFRFCGHDDRDRGQLGDVIIYAEMPTFEYDDDSTRDDLDSLFNSEGGE